MTKAESFIQPSYQDFLVVDFANSKVITARSDLEAAINFLGDDTASLTKGRPDSWNIRTIKVSRLPDEIKARLEAGPLETDSCFPELDGLPVSNWVVTG